MGPAPLYALFSDGPLVLVHGLEGSSESLYMLGIAEKAFEAGFNVLRVNQRNCGGTEPLTPTLQNSGLSSDYRSVLERLIIRDALLEVFFAGYSVGENLVLKMAGELGPNAPWELRGVCTVSPCVEAVWHGISSTNGIFFAASETPWRKRPSCSWNSTVSRQCQGSGPCGDGTKR
ncbi:MAG TPA: alpha/beta fold hydrolase [Candidatus Acidoferrum sp.]